MAETKNLCAQIDLALHTKVCEEREKAGQTTSQYITQLLMEYYEMKENGGKSSMENKGNRTMAFQISEELFQRIKRYLEQESKYLGSKYTQREFVLDLITEALDAAEELEATCRLYLTLRGLPVRCLTPEQTAELLPPKGA